jgi:hypothetical protein
MVGLLVLCVVGIMAGHTTRRPSPSSGACGPSAWDTHWGFKNGHMPCANTLSGLLRRLDADHPDRLLGAWLLERTGATRDQRNLDGKTLRGSRDGAVPGTHLLAAYAPQVSAVIAQMTVETTTNEHKALPRCVARGSSVVKSSVFLGFCHG